MSESKVAAAEAVAWPDRQGAAHTELTRDPRGSLIAAADDVSHVEQSDHTGDGSL
jgi:hypothetical protein